MIDCYCDTEKCYCNAGKKSKNLRGDEPKDNKGYTKFKTGSPKDRKSSYREQARRFGSRSEKW